MMRAVLLRNRLGAMERLVRDERLFRRQAACWAVVAAVELLVLAAALAGWNAAGVWWAVLAGGFAAAWLLRRRALRDSLLSNSLDPAAAPADAQRSEVISILNREFPEMRHLLSAASEQRPDPSTGELGFLQLRVIEEALDHPAARQWRGMMERKVRAARQAQLLALAAMLALFWLGHGVHRQRPANAVGSTPLFSAEIELAPGDVEVEKGSSLLISARFARPPAEAALVVASDSGKTLRLPMTRALSDPVFAASLANLQEGAVYRVEYGGRKSRDHKIRVFEYPALVRADADLAYPAYTGLTNRTIRDALRVSAVEGAALKYTLQLNKPVARARLTGRANAIELAAGSNGVAIFDAGFLTNSLRYSLQLTDSEGRSNRTPAEFVIQVLSNRPPEIRIVFPSGDQRVSPLEELELQGEARDDFGLLKYGVGYGLAGQEPRFVELGQAAAANEKRRFTNQIALEDLGLAENRLLSYFAWAEDYGPDGQPRRTFGDIYFAEVRPFEEVFRQDQSGASERGNRDPDQNQGGGQEGGSNNNPRLAELQKQIVIATWKLQKAGGVPAKGGKP
jgi:hypothetical protein